MAESTTSLQDLPPHLLYNILTQGSLSAVDLVHFEATCYTFRAAHGLLPLRFKSVVEIAALDLCKAHPLYSLLPPVCRMQLLRRCGSNWKMLLRFLQSTEQASGMVSTPKGKVQVAAGRYHSLLVHDGKDVFACGWGLPCSSLDQQGSSDNFRLFTPVAMPQDVLVTHIASSYQHAAFITSSGQLYTYGKNAHGCCGLEEANETVSEPTAVVTLQGIRCKQVATGQYFTMVLTAEGHVYTCGVNTHGQLGHGDASDRHVPTKVERLTCPAVQVSAGASHALAVTQDGALYSWGYGGSACLGHDGLVNEAQPRLIQSFKDKSLFVLGVSAGVDHSVALDSNGQVYTWGTGYCGALGHGNQDNVMLPRQVAGLEEVRAVQVCARKRGTFVLSDDGRLFAFGWMGCGSLGVSDRGDSEAVLTPTVLESLKCHHISQVRSGLYHTVVVTDRGAILGFGDNDRGQLGPRPSGSNGSEPIEMAYQNKCYILNYVKGFL